MQAHEPEDKASRRTTRTARAEEQVRVITRSRSDVVQRIVDNEVLVASKRSELRQQRPREEFTQVRVWSYSQAQRDALDEEHAAAAMHNTYKLARRR